MSTLCDPVACTPPGSSVHGILQARILEWVAISFSRELPIHVIQFIIHITDNRRVPQGGLRFYRKANESKKRWWSVLQWLLSGARTRQPQELAWFEISTSVKGRKAMGFFFFF